MFTGTNSSHVGDTTQLFQYLTNIIQNFKFSLGVVYWYKRKLHWVDKKKFIREIRNGNILSIIQIWHSVFGVMVYRKFGALD